MDGGTDPPALRSDSSIDEPADGWPVGVWAQRNGISRATAYHEHAEGRLIIRKVRKRGIVTGEDGDAWRRALPAL